jgi:MFS family permease
MTAAPLLTTGVSALGPFIRGDLNLSRTGFGLFAVVVFSTTALLSLPLGWLADRIGHRTGLGLNYLLSLAAIAVLATAQGLPAFFASAVIGAAALALSNPVTNRMVAVLGNPARRGSIIATKQVGPQLAQAITAAAYPAIAALFATWRAGLALGAALVVGAMVPSLAWLRRGAARRPEAAAASAEAPAPAATGKRRMLLVFTAYALLSGLAYQAVAFTLPLFAHDALGLSPALAALTGAVFGLVGLASRLAWGAIADRIGNPTGAMAVIAALSAVAVALFLAAAWFSAPWALWLGSALFGASGTAVMVILTASVLKHWPAANAGSATGVVALGTFIGFALGPYLLGALSDRLGYPTAWAALTAVLLAAALLPVASRAGWLPSAAATRPRS